MKDINGFTTTLIYSKLLYLNGLPRQTPRQQSEVTSVTYKTALVGATKYNTKS